MRTREIPLDPIVEQLHAVRRELVQEAGGSLEGLGESLMVSQQSHGARLVTDRIQAVPNWDAVAAAKPK